MAESDATETGTPPPNRWRKRFWWLFALTVGVPLLLAAIAAARFLPDRAVDYVDPEDQFKYGSTGGERSSGFPYWIWRALPEVCAEHLPGKGYQSVGMIYEQGRDLPVGVSKRRNLGLDRVFLNCAVCHVSTVRDAPNSTPKVQPGMPANTFNIMAFQKFFFACAKDHKFSAEYIVPEIKRQAGKLSLMDRYLVYPVAISIMRERLLMLAGRFSWADDQHDWGPGRVDTFNAAKVLFNFPVHRLPDREKNAPSDFPSIWNQEPRKGMQLHWDGNNDLAEERNKNAAFGTGTLPPTIDLARIARVENYLLSARPQDFPYALDEAKARRGAPIYAQYCAGCHGTSGSDFGGEQVGKVTPLEEVGTDRRRLDSFTYDLAVTLATNYAGYPWRFSHFRKTFGYANMPLDGIWLRAPYLHNGSVPTLRDLLEPTARRPKVFYRGNDVYDPVKVGFVSAVAEENGRKYFRFDVGVAGNGNQGHEGKRYGTQLSTQDKDALVEYLKKF